MKEILLILKVNFIKLKIVDYIELIMHVVHILYM